MQTPARGFDDFTEAAYAGCVRMARQRWRFIRFTDVPCDGRVVLWRHDVDLSPHRALRLARIEADEGVTSTFFIHLHSEFYNALERQVADIFRRIAGLGHEIGLHFDPNFHRESIQSREDIERLLKSEAAVIESLSDQPVRAFSFHNPDVGPWLAYDDDVLGGLRSAYGRTIKRDFQYCSDSNGYWRFRRLQDVLADESIEKLHVLTHPGWWQVEAMSPKARVLRCIQGRASAVQAGYEKLLADNNRVDLE